MPRSKAKPHPTLTDWRVEDTTVEGGEWITHAGWRDDVPASRPLFT